MGSAPPSDHRGDSVNAQPSNLALVNAARGNHGWAQEALYRRHVESMFALAVRLLGSRDLAWDAVQNAFITAFRKLDKLRDPAAFAAWLRAIVVRETLTIRRRERRGGSRRDDGIDVNSIASDEATAEERMTFVRLQRWVDGIREPDRTIYLLKVIDACELDAIAALVGVSIATVKRKAARVEAKLRALGMEPVDE